MRDLAKVHSVASAAAPWAALAIFGVLVPLGWLTGNVEISTVNTWGKILAVACMAVGIDLVWGYTGMLSLCQALFFTLGGYCMGMHLAMHGPMNEGVPNCLFIVSSEVKAMALPTFWKPFSSFAASVALLVLVPGLVALIFGWFAFRSRVKGVYFSIITQALTIAAWLVFCRNEMQLCGTNGINNLTTFLGFELREPSTKMGLYIATVAALAGCIAIARWVAGTRTGRVLVAIRDNESRLRFAGYQPVAYKCWVFALAAVLAAIGGALYVPQNGIMTPQFMTAKESVIAVVMVALGGRGTIMGAVVGAVLWKWLELKLTTWLPTLWPFVTGGLCIGVVLFLPGGIVGAWRALGERLRPAPARVAPPGSGEPPRDATRPAAMAAAP